MLLKDGTTSKNMLPRGITSLLDSVKNKASAAGGPAAAAGGGGAAGAHAAGLQKAPLATPKHHATEGRNDLQIPGCVPSGFWQSECTSLLDSAGLQNAPLRTKRVQLTWIPAGGPAAAAGGGAAGAHAAGLQNAPLATPKHHATEGRNDLQKHAALGLDVPSGFW